MKIKRLETFSTRNQPGATDLDDGRRAGQMSTFNADISAQVFTAGGRTHALGAVPINWTSCWIPSWSQYSSRLLRAGRCAADTGMGPAAGWKAECVRCSEDAAAFPGLRLSMNATRGRGPPGRALRWRSGYRVQGAWAGVQATRTSGWAHEALIPAVRRAIGGDAVLLADGNSCYTPARAIQVGRLLEEYNEGHFEEPCPYWELK
jgi:hypothetical protein